MADKSNENKPIGGKPAKGKRPRTNPAVYVVKPPKPPRRGIWPFNRKRGK